MLYNKNFNPQLYGAVIKGHGIRGGIKTPTVYIGTNNNEDLPHFQRGDLLDANATIDTIKDIMGGDIPEGLEERIQYIENRVGQLNDSVSHNTNSISKLSTSYYFLQNRVTNIQRTVYDEITPRILPHSIIPEIGGLYQVKNDSVYPVAHPDLSTQPSVLPQRFGNFTMYEVLVPTLELGIGIYIPTSYVPLDATITECFLICDNFTTPAYAVRSSNGWAIDLFKATAYNTTSITPPEFDFHNGMALVRYYMKNSNTYYSGYDQGGDNVIFTIYGGPGADGKFYYGIESIYGFDTFDQFLQAINNYGIGGGDVVGMVHDHDMHLPLKLSSLGTSDVSFEYGFSLLRISMHEMDVIEDGPYLTSSSRIEFFKLQ